MKPGSTETPLGAVLVAAGRGTRFGGPIPKQFERLGGVPLYLISLRKLAALPGMRAVALVLPGDGSCDDVDTSIHANPAQSVHSVHQVHTVHAPDLTAPPPILKIRGGDRRQDSVAAGLAAIAPYLAGAPDTVALVHDAARPFFPLESLDELTARAVAHGGAILAAPVHDTVKRANATGLIEATIPRDGLWLAQTPQAVRADLIAPLIAELSGPRDHTDEASVLETLGVSVAVVAGSPDNFKITRPEDLARAERIFRDE